MMIVAGWLKRRRGAVIGFTLIELLVVVSIMMILMSLLLPSLGKARERGRQILCQNNLRTIYTAELSYADNFNGTISKGLEGAGLLYWCQRLEHESLIKGRVFDCPTNDSQLIIWWPLAMCNGVCDYTRSSELNYLKLGGLRNPSCTVMTGELVPLQAPVFTTSSYMTRLCLLIHNRIGNLLFVDGHVAGTSVFDAGMLVVP